METASRSLQFRRMQTCHPRLLRLLRHQLQRLRRNHCVVTSSSRSTTTASTSRSSCMILRRSAAPSARVTPSVPCTRTSTPRPRARSVVCSRPRPARRPTTVIVRVWSPSRRSPSAHRHRLRPLLRCARSPMASIAATLEACSAATPAATASPGTTTTTSASGCRTAAASSRPTWTTTAAISRASRTCSRGTAAACARKPRAASCILL